MSGPIHMRHFRDGYPLCWTLDQDGPFVGSFVDSDVTCPECLRHLGEAHAV